MTDFRDVAIFQFLKAALNKTALLNAVSACGVSSNNSGRSEFMTEDSPQARKPARPVSLRLFVRRH